MKFSKAVVKLHIPILILSLALMIPAFFGYVNTRVNYDMLYYLPQDIDTVKGQDLMLEDFGQGAFSVIILEGMSPQDVTELNRKIEKVDHVQSVLWYDSFADISIPMELLPEKIYNAFNTEDETLIAVFFDTTTSSDLTMDAVREIRGIAGKQCFVTGMSALVTDLKDLCEKEEPIYVGIAVALALLAMIVLLDNWLIPFVFLLSIGMMILLNMGTNYFLGEISYITKALSAVLQLAVTMDYSIFLWDSFNEELASEKDENKAMASAISRTLTSVIGSSITTIAGFFALCFMSFTLGRDLGIVMAKGVILGVIGSVTVLPALILIFHKPLQKAHHRSIIPPAERFSAFLTKHYVVFLILFLAIIPPALYGYIRTNDEVYYDMGQCLPEDIDYVTASRKLRDDFDMASTHMVLIDSSLPVDDVRAMAEEMEEIDGVDFVLCLESLIGDRVPRDLLPESLTSLLRSDRYELVLVNSKYKVASDAANEQLARMNDILKKYDPNGMLVGEGPCMKDMIDITGHDFRVVTMVSLFAIFLIILLVERSLSLPFILIALIETAIFINLGLPHYLGQSLPFIAPICISTIQLGATVDYAILMTTRYKAERKAGKEKREAVNIALSMSIPSVIVSGMGLFSATFGVAVYSQIDIISSMCMLMARGAIISMLMVIFVLPALLQLFDGAIRQTSMGMKPDKAEK